jgi:hypothetical protein
MHNRLTKAQIEEAFVNLDRELGILEIKAEVFVVGGAVMCIALDARSSTQDVGAWFHPTQEVREAASRVATQLGLPDDWLNDAAKAFLPAKPAFERWRSWPHLEVSVADAHTLLAMKCAAARTAEDAVDIRFLASHLGLSRASEVLEIVSRFFPEDRLPVRSRLLIEEIFSDGN